jgi:hypothetical protein
MPAGSAAVAVTVLITFGFGCAPLTLESNRGRRSDRPARNAGPTGVAVDLLAVGEIDRVGWEAPLDSETARSGAAQSGTEVGIPTEPPGLSIAEVVARARTDHPLAIASARLIEQARGNVRPAGRTPNPEFVLDIETPVHESSDATELSTRVTFPIGQKRGRNDRMRVARAGVAAATAGHVATLRRLSENALSAATLVAYLQERALIDQQSERLARERMRLLAPEFRDGNAAANLVDFVDASEEFQRASRQQFETARELTLARVALADAMGIDLANDADSAEWLSVDVSLRPSSLALPPLRDVIAATLGDSAELAASHWAAEQGWREQRAARNPNLRIEAGPLYQDRLGRDDDTIGVRFRSDVPLNDQTREDTLIAGIRAQTFEDQVQLKRHEIAITVARDYRELESIAEQLRQDRSDSFLSDQTEILGEAEAADLMTGQQVLRIKQTMLRRKRDLLDLEYRFVMLRSKLRLHAVSDPSY